MVDRSKTLAQSSTPSLWNSTWTWLSMYSPFLATWHGGPIKNTGTVSNPKLMELYLNLTVYVQPLPSHMTWWTDQKHWHSLQPTVSNPKLMELYLNLTVYVQPLPSHMTWWTDQKHWHSLQPAQSSTPSLWNSTWTWLSMYSPFLATWHGGPIKNTGTVFNPKLMELNLNLTVYVQPLPSHMTWWTDQKHWHSLQPAQSSTPSLWNSTWTWLSMYSPFLATWHGGPIKNTGTVFNPKLMELYLNLTVYVQPLSSHMTWWTDQKHWHSLQPQAYGTQLELDCLCTAPS